MTGFTEGLPLTVVRVPHCGVFGVAGVKVGHEGSDVLCGSEHSMSNLPHEDEPWWKAAETQMQILKTGHRRVFLFFKLMSEEANMFKCL